MTKGTTLQELAKEFIRPVNDNRNPLHDAEITVLRLCRRLDIDLPISLTDAERIRQAEIKTGPKPTKDSAGAKASRAYRVRQKEKKLAEGRNKT